MRSQTRGVGAALLLGIVALSTEARAQAESPPFDPSIDVQTFEYAIGPKSFFTVANADVATPKQMALDFLITYLTAPFRIYDVDNDDPDMITGERVTVVDSLTSAQITGAYGVSDKFQLGVFLPIIFRLEGDGLEPDTGTPVMGGLSVTGLGDLLVEGKYKLYAKDALKAAALAQVSLPSSFGSGDSQFIGDDLPSFRGKFLVQVSGGRLSVGANAGILLRKPRKIYDSTIGQQLLWGVGANLAITNKFSLIAESYGRAGFDFSLDASPLEAIGGLRLYATNSVGVVLGGGAGLMKGIGSPESRFFLSVGYSPDVRDSDGDGIANARDKCPNVAEDKDGSQDSDGCPDDDDDGDRRPDAEDKCPAVAEDLDGFDDDDGCPEADNDGDKIEDLKDKCINDAEDGKEPAPTDGCPASKRDSDADNIMDSIDACPAQEEDMDGFEDGDGCPEADNDLDGIVDGSDKCPLCTEDKDSFEDGDGCPELDNDKDGVADTQDKCPAEAETLNGVNDGDGCPDAPAAFVKLEGDRLVVDKVPTMAGRGLSVPGNQVVDAIAIVLANNPDIKKVLIALAQPNAANATALANAVKMRLVAKGIAPERVEVIGAAGAAKIGGVVQERSDEAPAFVCPAGMLVQPKTGPAIAPTPTPTTGLNQTDDKDTDGDDFTDANDQCPDKPETLNSYEDDDGCPDTIPTALKQFSGNVQGVNFKSGSAELLPASLAILDNAAKAFGEFPTLKVEIQGHTDDVAPGRGGKFADNKALSQARADSVKAYLTKKGIDGSRLTAKGFGDEKPVIDPKTVKGAALNNARTRNRRVEFKLLAD